mmetsp:Transcript_27352/g.86222  ORF Transcript_27352/g.86222 Transcript_27352/m.86222 type:complete len:169 (-) Transcript_27352:2-508(-)
MTVCIGLGGGDILRISKKDDCAEDGWRLAARFPARTTAAASEADRLLCVEDVGGTIGDMLRESRDCGPKQKFAFAVPRDPRPQDGVPEAARRQRVCVFPPAERQGPRATVGHECEASGGAGVLSFEAASIMDVLASVPGAGKVGPPLFTIVEEEVPCFPFLCPGVLLS